MSRYLGILTDKAQIALDKTGIGAHLPTSHTQRTQQPVSPNDQRGYISDDAPDGRASRHPAIESLSHSLRALHARYTEPSPPELRQLQIRITNSKGIVLDLDTLSRDMKASSKDYYLWGQEQDEDIKDVSDRMAYFEYVTGSVLAHTADLVESSRAPLKELRTTAQTLAPRRAQRTQLEAHISANRAAGKPNIGELEEQLAKQTRDDEPLEREVAVARRKAMLESERIRFEAMREQGEKFILIAQAAQEALAQLSPEPPTLTNPYKGHKATANARNALQVALDTWKPGMTTLPTLAPHHSDSRSFGVTHATELSRVNSFSSTSKTKQEGTLVSQTPEHTGLGPRAGDSPVQTRHEPHIEVPISPSSETQPNIQSGSPSSLPTSYPTLHASGLTPLTPAATEIGAHGPTLPARRERPALTTEPPLARDDTVKSTASAVPAYQSIDRDAKIEPLADGGVRVIPAKQDSLGGTDGPGDYRAVEEKRALERKELEKDLRGEETRGLGDVRKEEYLV